MITIPFSETFPAIGRKQFVNDRWRDSKLRLVTVALVAVILLAKPGASLAVERPDAALPAETDVQTQLRADVAHLASEELRGRDVADASIHQAANYIAGRMGEIGLQVDTIDGEPYQSVSVTLGAQAGPVANNQVTFSFDGQPASDHLTAVLNKGMNPLSIGAVKGAATGKVAFVGYGITAPGLKYDDYLGIDVQDAIVILMRKEPGVADPNSPFDGVRNTRHAYFATKIENAVKHGAAGVMIVNDPKSIEEAAKIIRYKIATEKDRADAIREQIAKLPNEARNSLNTFRIKLDGITASIESLNLELVRAESGLLGISEAGGASKEDVAIPVVSISRQLVNQLLLRSVGESLSDIDDAINDTIRPHSRVLTGVTCSLKSELKPTSASSPNVVGVIPGKGDLAGECVVLGAHYDHVGMGGYGSLAPGTIAIHNGADDNASGVATMLASGKILKQRLQGRESHRRIVLIAFTGEERGLVGSKYYVDNPLYPLVKTAGMVNLDMVGRLRDNELTVYGTGTAEGLDAMLENANETHAFDLFKVPSGYGPSDHQSFYKAGVPVLFFFTGLHNDYHRPSDDFEKIDFGGMTRITDIVCDVTLQLAIESERPKYAETENRVQIRRQLTAYLGVTLSDRGDHVVLSGVSLDSPALRGGLQKGDQLSRIGKRRVRTSADVFELLRGRSPGDSVVIQILRDGNPLNVKVKLGKRPTG